VIVGVQGTAARLSQETVAAQDMIARFAHWQVESQLRSPRMQPMAMGSCCNGCWVAASRPYMRTRDSARRKNNPGYGPERFTYLPESN